MRALPLVLLAGLVSAALAAAPASATLPSNLAYLFDGSGAGSPGLTLAFHGGASASSAYGVGHGAEVPGDFALGLDGDDDYAEAQDSAFRPGSGGDFSISVWAKSTGWGFSWQPLAFMDDDDYSTYSWALYGTTAPSGTVHAYVRMRDGSSLDTLDLHGTGTTLSDGDWHNLVLVVAGNEATLYFDGTQIDERTSTLTTGAVNADADHLFVGGDLYYASEKFRGSIDRMRYFDSAVDASTVALLANRFGCC